MDLELFRDCAYSERLGALFHISFVLFQSHRNPGILSIHLRVLAQQLLRFLRNYFRQRYLHFDKLVAVNVGVAQRRRAAAAQSKLLTGLCARGYTQLRFTCNSRHFYLRAERSFRYGDWHRYIDVVTLACEILMPADIRD